MCWSVEHTSCCYLDHRIFYVSCKRNGCNHVIPSVYQACITGKISLIRVNSCHSFVRRYEIMCSNFVHWPSCTTPLVCHVWDEKWPVWVYLSQFNRAIIHITFSICTTFGKHCLFFCHIHAKSNDTQHIAGMNSSHPKPPLLCQWIACTSLNISHVM